VWSAATIGTDGTIYFGSNDNYLYALNSDGTLKWRYQTDGFVQASPALADNSLLYVVSRDGYLYVIYGSGILANTPWPMFHHDLQHTGRE